MFRVVGRLPNIQLLNGSYISDFQREESERFFIRYYQCAAAADKPQIYEKLVLKHGELEQLVKVDLTPKEFARVQIHCEETGYSSWARIKLRTSVQSLMRYIEQKTNIPLKKMRLFYYDANVYGLGPTELRFPKQVFLIFFIINQNIHIEFLIKILQTLHIEDGDKFLILVCAIFMWLIHSFPVV
jgi:hypothetical protein